MQIKDLKKYPRLYRLALQRQVEAGNKDDDENWFNVAKDGGFDWDKTDEDFDFWNYVCEGEFNKAFEMNPELQYLDKEDFIKGEVYFESCSTGDRIFKRRATGYLHLQDKKYYGSLNKTEINGYVRHATPEEFKRLEACEKAGKYVDAPLSDGIDRGEVIKATDVDQRIFLDRNSVSKGIIDQITSNDPDFGFGEKDVIWCQYKSEWVKVQQIFFDRGIGWRCSGIKFHDFVSPLGISRSRDKIFMTYGSGDRITAKEFIQYHTGKASPITKSNLKTSKDGKNCKTTNGDHSRSRSEGRHEISFGGCGNGLETSDRERRVRSAEIGKRKRSEGEGLRTRRRSQRSVTI